MRISLLVLTDFKPAAERALTYANTLATAIGADLLLLHARRDSPLDPGVFTGLLPQQSQEDIDAALARAARGLTAPVVTKTGHGQVAEVVAHALVGHPSALVVVGRPDEDSIPDELISTTALDLLRAVRQPMLVVPRHAPATPPPHRVLLAVDAEPFTLSEANEEIQYFFRALYPQLTVVHISSAPDEAVATAAFEATMQLPLIANLDQVETMSLIEPSVADGILRAAATGSFDLIILIARPRSFMGALFHHSVTAEVLLHSPLPVLVLPAK